VVGRLGIWVIPLGVRGVRLALPGAQNRRRAHCRCSREVALFSNLPGSRPSELNPSLPSETIYAHAQNCRSITLQLVERREAPGQGEDQRLDGPGDFQAVANRPIRVGGGGPNTLKQFRAGKETVGPQISGDWDHPIVGNTTLLLKWSTDVHLVNDYVLKHGQRRQSGQMRASEHYVSKLLEKLRDGGRSSLSGILGDIPVDSAP